MSEPDPGREPVPVKEQNAAVAEADRIREETKAAHDRAARESARK